MVYSINDRKTFENIEMWLRDLRTHSNPDVKVFLIGNKIDLEKEREVSKEEGENFCKDNNLNLFMEASAKTGINTQSIFLKAAEILLDDYIKYENERREKNKDENNDEQEGNKKISEFDEGKKKEGCC